MKILDYLSRNMIIMDMKKKHKDEAIEDLVSFMMQMGVSGDRRRTVEALLEREKNGSTAIGNGVAIPHAKTDAVDSLGLVYAYSSEGVEFNSIDGKSSHFFFLVVSPPGEAPVQLRLLARISRLMGNRNLRNELETVDAPEKVMRIIEKYED